MVTFERNVAALKDQLFDVAIVGGGISGAWLALHCAQSGYKTALVEQQDFASQTSSSSSKLLHGGIRYLQQLEFGKVRESALERAHYIKAAPHLSRSVPFLIPTYKDLARSKLFLGCGMIAYSLLTIGENKLIGDKDEFLPGISSISAERLNQLLNLGDEPHTGAIQFYERHLCNSERMVLEILKTASQLGATIANYCSATQLIQNDGNQISGLLINDALSQQNFQLNANLVINAAGPWVDDLDTQIESVQKNITGYAVGSHIITRQLSDRAIAITTTHESGAAIDRGGRHIFVIPWQQYSLIGTSYHEVEQAEKDMLPQAEHVRDLMQAVNQGIPSAQLTRKDIISGYSGLYPLRTEEIDASVYQGSGEYVIIDHSKNNSRKGLITALGAKYTTGRKLSALTMPLVQKQLGGSLNLTNNQLDCSRYQSFKAFQTDKQQQYSHLFSQQTLTHLLQQYGSNIDTVASLVEKDASLGKLICDHLPDIAAQIIFSFRFEQAQTLEDILFRRTSIGLLGLKDAALIKVAALAQREADWSDATTKTNLDQVSRRISAINAALDSATLNTEPSANTRPSAVKEPSANKESSANNG